MCCERDVCKALRENRSAHYPAQRERDGSKQPSRKGDTCSSFLSVLYFIEHPEVAKIWLQMFV